jgi:hypothetical protein
MKGIAMSDEKVERAVVHLLESLWLYGSQGRGPSGKLLDAIAELMPHVASNLREGAAPESLLELDPLHGATGRLAPSMREAIPIATTKKGEVPR